MSLSTSLTDHYLQCSPLMSWEYHQLTVNTGTHFTQPLGGEYMRDQREEKVKGREKGKVGEEVGGRKGEREIEGEGDHYLP